MLTLKDPQLSQSHEIPPEGATIGREGGDADITVRSASVSKKHARLYASNGGWWLKDLGSANGTFVGKDRISKPMELRRGSTFTLSGYRFEVASIEGADPREQDAGATVTGLPPVNRMGPGSGPVFDPPPSPARGVRAAPSSPQRMEPRPIPGKTGSGPNPSRPPPNAGRNRPSQELLPEEAIPDADEAEEASANGASGAQLQIGPVSFGDAMKELPKAIAYYLVTIPKLLFNPLGTIRNSIEEQKVPPMRGMPLMGWALPGMAVIFAIGLLCQFIVVLVTAIRGGGFAIGSLIVSIILVPVGGIIGGLLIAFVWHPLMAFIIKLLKGHSDEGSRTNYMAISMATAALTQVPAGLLVIITAFASLIPVAVVQGILQLLPSLLVVAASAVSMAVVYFWFKFFEVHPIVQKVILVLGALSVVFGLYNAVMGALHTFRGGGATVAGVTVQMPAGMDPKDWEKAQAELQKAAKNAESAAKQGQAIAEKASADAEAATKQARQGAEAAAGDAKKAVADANAATAKAAEATGNSAKAAQDVAAVAPAAAAEHADSAAPPAAAEAGASTAYQRYAQHRDFIDKKIESDPTVLTRDGQVLSLYKKFDKIRRDIKKKNKGGADDVVTQRLIEAETYEKAAKVVEELYQRLSR